MQKSDFLGRYVTPFEGVSYIYKEDKGYIVWRLGTGDNVELLHIRTFKKGLGYGRQLFYGMLNGVKTYYSVFGFTRVGNQEAHAFYGALGFNLQTVSGLYQEGSAILFWQSYEKLLEARSEYENRLHSIQE